MIEYGLPALFATVLWWGSTGVILYMDGLPARTFRRTMLGSTLVLGASLIGLAWSAGDTSLAGAYVAFTCGLIAWGWQQVAFYLGYLTGPRREACSPGASGFRRFVQAFNATLYQELAAAISALVIAGVVWGAENRIGLWTFLVLWGMHISAKLNVFLGVRNLNEEFFPDHLRYLESFLQRKRMNALLPISLIAGTAVTTWLAKHATELDASPSETAGFTFVATMSLLGVLEHALLVLPLPAARLWEWGLRSREL